MNIAVFGGSGFIFRQVLRYGVERNHKMFCIDLKEPDYQLPGMTYIKANAASEGSTDLALRLAERHLKESGLEDRIDAVANGIAILSYTKSVDQLYVPNVMTARNIAKACRKRNTFMVHMSGVAVQGVSNPTPLKEEYQLDPIEPYGITKALSELEVYDATNYGLDAIILRANGVVGPECLNTMIINMFDQVKKKPIVPLPATLNSYINTLDIGKAIIFAIENQHLFRNQRKNLHDIVYNICDKEPRKDSQIFEHLIKRIPSDALFRLKVKAPGKYGLLATGFLAEAVARLTKKQPALPYNLARLVHAPHCQSREKFENVFEKNGFQMTFNSTEESLDNVIKWLYNNYWKEQPAFDF